MKYHKALILAVASLLHDATAQIPEGAERFSDQIRPFAAAPPVDASEISRTGWTASCNADVTTGRCAAAIDGSTTTFWQTPIGANRPPFPHTITVDMKTVHTNVHGISMYPRQGGDIKNYIGRHEVYLSTDGTNWGNPVAWGTWWGDKYLKRANFEPKDARYVRLVALSNEDGGYPGIGVSDFKVYRSTGLVFPQEPGKGTWGETLNFPVIPVAGTVNPLTGNVFIWSAYRYDAFSGPTGGFTLSSVWDRNSGVITKRNITDNRHDMFCPGISIDGDGGVVVTGGNNAEKTTVYDPVSDSWVPSSNMKIARGYQSSATTSDGRVFTIGGSWSGPRGGKNGEIYNYKTKQWQYLPKCLVQPMLTNDKEGVYKSDNHAWLFGWKDGYVFQAGPSTAMNWYYTKGSQGGQKGAGKRTTAAGGDDPDSMNGNAVMFNALEGKILTTGGAKDYRDADGSPNAHVITLGAPGELPTVSRAGANGKMQKTRVFHGSAVLPDGTVFLNNGQTYSKPFTDETPEFSSEIYDPETNTFTLQASNSLPRTYHSIAMLLPDGTVFAGGGGLCGSCDTNHFDAQVFTPHYLYNSNGELATRPKITATSATTAEVGSTITINTNGPVAKASLIRYSTVTHVINTDQRLIPLTLNDAGTNKYTFKIPEDPGIAIPGYWMLFVLNSNGVPSVSTTIKVEKK